MQRAVQQSIATLLAGILLAGPGCVSHDTEKADQRTGEHHFERKSNNNRRGNTDDDYLDDLDGDDVTGLAGLGVLTIAVIAWPFTQIYTAVHRANGDTPLKAARAMDNPDFPDARIQGINDLATHYEFAHHPPYTLRYQELAQRDPDYLVRATAIRALNISRDKTATPIFIADLEDEHEPIRLEACKALNNIPDERAIPGLLRRLEGRRETVIDGRPQETEEDADVRVAAAQALRQYPKLDVATALVSYLNERNFAVAWQAHGSLRHMTNADWNYDESAWLRYLSGPKRPLAS